MQITEPMTMVSDYLLAAFAVLLALPLLRLGRLLSQASIRLWGFALLATAMPERLQEAHPTDSPFISGEAGHAVAWKITVYSIGMASSADARRARLLPRSHDGCGSGLLRPR